MLSETAIHCVGQLTVTTLFDLIKINKLPSQSSHNSSDAIAGRLMTIKD